MLIVGAAVRRQLATLASCLLLMSADGGQGGPDGPPCPRKAKQFFAVGTVTEVRERKPPCRIEFRETGIRLEAVADGSRLDPGRTVLMDSSGRFISANAPGWRFSIGVWDSRGNYLSSFGREGQGPGEFVSRGMLSLFIDSADNLHVRDGGLGWSVFTPEHEFLRRVPANVMGGLPGNTVILDDGSALASDGLGPDRGHYFRVVDSMGALLRVFGPVEARSTGTGRRAIAYAGGETFWVGPPEEGANAYVLEEWGVDGERRRSLHRDASWYGWNGSRETSPIVRQLHIAPGGLLYAMVVRPTEDYLKEYAGARRAGQPLDRERRDLLTEVVVEVIDTRSGELLASEVFRTSEAREIVPRGLFRGVVAWVSVQGGGRPAALRGNRRC